MKYLLPLYALTALILTGCVFDDVEDTKKSAEQINQGVQETNRGVLDTNHHIEETKYAQTMAGLMATLDHGVSPHFREVAGKRLPFASREKDLFEYLAAPFPLSYNKIPNSEIANVTIVGEEALGRKYLNGHAPFSADAFRYLESNIRKSLLGIWLVGQDPSRSEAVNAQFEEYKQSGQAERLVLAAPLVLGAKILVPKYEGEGEDKKLVQVDLEDVNKDNEARLKWAAQLKDILFFYRIDGDKGESLGSQVEARLETSTQTVTLFRAQ